MAVGAKRPQPGLIHHSNRGSQYCAQDYQDQLESFWGTLKNELLHHRRYDTRAQTRQEIAEYIEIFYNRQRRHSRLGNRSPDAFAQQWARHQPAA